MANDAIEALPPSDIPGDIAHLHPAVLGAVLHRGRVGGRETAATLVHLGARGFVRTSSVSVAVRSWGRTVTRESIELHLPKGPARAPHHSGGPIVRQGHVDGLTRIDRELLTILFDHVAHGDRVTLAQIDAFSGRHRYAYWTAMTRWRHVVVDEARSKGLLGGGENRVPRRDLRQLKREVRRRLSEPGQIHHRLAELAVVFGLGGRSLYLLPAAHSADASPSAGSDSLRWLVTGAGRMSSTFSPYYYAFGSPPELGVGAATPGYLGGGGGGGGGLSSGSGAGGGFSSGGGDGGGGGGGGAG